MATAPSSTMVTASEVLAAQATASHLGLILATGVMFLHGMMSGASLGYSGLVLPHHLDPDSNLVLLTQDQATWLNSITPLSMGLAVLLSIPASELLGRKKMFLLSSFISLAGYIMLYLAPTFLVLLAGQGVQCLGPGLGAMTIGGYLSEISLVRLRGPLVCCCLTSQCMGVLVYTATSSALPMELLAVVLASHSALTFLLELLLPESPQWLARQDGREEDVRRSLLTLRFAIA